ncbi:MAG: RagB/SusD family nutrient uptake outer membrane protein [Prevotellaceae bacterium]|nr:RagB/SusD family nutrient uptake outer membrane protein [Prevotellaceae bacterium]
MKTIIKYFALTVFVTLLFAACSKDLETNPTDQTSGPVIFADENAAQTAIEGVYALLWRPSFVSGNTSHAYGHQSTLFAQDMMADDITERTAGNGWYMWDYQLDYTGQINNNSIGTASRSYNVWNMYYTIISNVNYIIAQEGNIGSNGNVAKNIIAQAYAIRAFAYFELIQGYQKTYQGHQNDPGVPVYTEPTRSGDEGKPRGTVEEVYTQINADIASALALFTEAGKTRQTHSSHVDYYVTKGFEARIALVQGDNQKAYNAAEEALSRLSRRALLPADITQGFSNKTLATTLWAMEVIPDQTSIYGSLYCHLDARDASAHGSGAPKCISSWLYGKIVRYDDARRQWFNDGSNSANPTTGMTVNYLQKKRMSRELANWVGDFIFMRGEEMLLIAAEAKARLSQAGDARNLLLELAQNRLSTSALTAYTTYLNALSTAVNPLPADTNTDPSTVLEEVLLQRRIELWGEVGRIKDILRLKQGYNRNYSGSNHTQMLVSRNSAPESGAFLFFIPQSEFDGNKNILSSEQNPIE